MLRIKIVLLFLGVLLVSTAAEECPLTELIDFRIESDFAAVVSGVDSIAGCVKTLTQNKDSHSAVSFNKLTGKCCAAPKGSSYALVHESGWITYQIRNDSQSQGQTTNYPSKTTQISTSSPWNTTQRLVYGICNGVYEQKFLELDEVLSLSVYDYYFDMCVGFPDSAKSYNNVMYCQYYLFNQNADGFEYTLKHDFAYDDYLQMTDENGSKYYYGVNYIAGFTRGSYLNLLFYSSFSSVSRGFCLKISPKRHNDSTTITWPTTTAAPVTDKVYGIVNSSGGYLDLAVNQEATLSVYEYDYDACENFPVSLKNTTSDFGHNYIFYMTISSPNADGFEYSLSMSISIYYSDPYATYLYIFGNGFGGSKFYSQSIIVNAKGYVSGKEAYLQFYDRSLHYHHKGFCIRITPRRNGIPLTPPLESTAAPAEALTTFGICRPSNSIKLATDQTAVISLYDYNYDMCGGFPSNAFFYNNDMQCAFKVYPNDADGFEFSISYDIASGDRLSLRSWSANNKSYGGHFFTEGRKNDVVGYILGQVDIDFYSDYKDVGKGFCLKITARRNRDKFPFVRALESTISQPEAANTYGVCNGESSVTISESAVFTFEPYTNQVCDDFSNSMKFYSDGSNCSVVVNSYNDTVGYKYSIVYQTENYCDYVSLSNNTRGESEVKFSGSSFRDGYLHGGIAYIQFHSNAKVRYLGFCLSLHPVRQSQTGH